MGGHIFNNKTFGNVVNGQKHSRFFDWVYSSNLIIFTPFAAVGEDLDNIVNIVLCTFLKPDVKMIIIF